MVGLALVVTGLVARSTGPVAAPPEVRFDITTPEASESAAAATRLNGCDSDADLSRTAEYVTRSSLEDAIFNP